MIFGWIVSVGLAPISIIFRKGIDHFVSYKSKTGGSKLLLALILFSNSLKVSVHQSKSGPRSHLSIEFLIGTGNRRKKSSTNTALVELFLKTFFWNGKPKSLLALKGFVISLQAYPCS